MISEASTSGFYTREQVAAMEFCAFPGGYSPSDTRGECWFDVASALRAVNFGPKFFRHVKGKMGGQPLALAQWQAEWFATMFGWKRMHPEHGEIRRYRMAHCEIPRGNGKTTACVVVVGILLFIDDEPGADIFSAAGTRDQAKEVFNPFKTNVLSSRGLKRVSQAYMNSVVRLSAETGLPVGAYKAISADADFQHGGSPHGIIFDELHVQPNRDLWDVLHTGKIKRREPLTVAITTAGYDRESICYEQHDYAIKVRDGIVDDQEFLPIIYAADDEDEWTDPEVWRKANPNLGVSIFEEDIAKECRKAQDVPAFENTFKRLHLNLWCVVRGTLFRLDDGSLVAVERLKPGDTVEAFDEETWELLGAKVQRISTMPPAPIYRINTSRGRSIRVSAEHPFWCRTGRADNPKYGWVKASELKPGSRVAIALGRSRTRRRGANADTARFLGIFVGDGTCNGTPRLTSIDKEIIAFTKAFIEEIGDRFAPLPDGVHFDARHKAHTLRRTGTRKLLQKNGLWHKDCRTKRVPDAVFKGGPEVWSAFLSGYLDTDGHVGERVSGIIWISASRELLSECQELLAFLGMQSTLTESRAGIFRLQVMDAESYDIAASTLTPLVERKRNALKMLTDLPRRTGSAGVDRRRFDRVASVTVETQEETFAVTVAGTHTHVTNGIITHNTEQCSRAIPMQAWDACGEGTDPHQWRADMLETMKGRECLGGLDIATRVDVTAFVLLFSEDDELIFLPWFWVPSDAVTRRAREPQNTGRYQQWAQAGFMEVIEGPRIDQAVIRRRINELNEAYRIREIAYDNWNAEKLRIELEEDGLTMLEFHQSMKKFNEPLKDFLSQIAAGNVRHGNNPVLRWMASNLSTKEDASGNMRPDKKSSGDKIDGIVASVMALAVAMHGEEQSVYETRGVRTI